MSQVIGGRFVTQGTFRPSRVGSWFVLSDPDGQLRGGLRLNVLDQVETQRLLAVLAIGPGLLNVVDQVRDESGHWLVTATPATPSLAEVLGARLTLPPAVALLVAVDTAETLAALHNASTAHGGVSTDTVIVGADGRVLLAEPGYAHALQGTVPGPGHDTTAWVKVLRALANARPADDARRMLSDAANEAEAHGGAAGLNAGLARLSQQVRHVPGYGDRSALAMVSGMVSEPRQAQRLEDNETVQLSPGNAVTVPATPAAPASPARTAILPPPEQETLQPAQLAAQLEQRKEDVLRFGRGVAALPQPQQPQRAETAWGQVPSRPQKRRKPWRARIIGILSTLLTLVLVAWVGYQVIQRLIPIRISGATVTLSESLEGKCDVEARVMGVIRTNGAAGTITYVWLTSDGKATGTLAEQVNLGTDRVPVTLLWKFSGKSTVRAKATLHILTPSEHEASTEFTYSCK